MTSQSSFLNFRTYFALFLITWKDKSESIWKVFLDLLIMAVRFGLTVILYTYVAEYNGGLINGYSVNTIAWSMYMYFAIYTINPRYIAREIQNQIKTGNIETIFTKPVNYIFYRMFYYLGMRMSPFIFTFSVSFAVMLFVFGTFENMHNPLYWLTFLFTLFFSFLISFTIFAIIGVLAFWIEDVMPIQWIFDKMIMLLGGAYLPIFLMPEVMKNFSHYSPFGASQFLTQSVQSSWLSNYFEILALQIFWLLILSLLLWRLFVRATKKLSVNGG